MNNGFMIPKYPLPVFSAGDDAGVSTGGSKNTLVDLTKYWVPGIWQGAILVVAINDQLHITVVSNNTEQRLTFPAFPSNVKVGQNNYTLKRLPPALVRPGINLTGTQVLAYMGITFTNRVPFPYPANPFVQPLLPAGAETSIIGPSGAFLPFVLPAGYTGTLIDLDYHFDQDSEQWFYFDGVLIDCIAMANAGVSVYEAPVAPFGSTITDPLAQFAHLVDWKVKNRGLSPMSGDLTVVFMLEAI